MKVGSIVLCDKLAPISSWDKMMGVIFPIVGQRYTIREIASSNNKTGLILEEIVNPILNYADATAEKAFDIKGFRELLPPNEAEAILQEALTICVPIDQ